MADPRLVVLQGITCKCPQHVAVSGKQPSQNPWLGRIWMALHRLIDKVSTDMRMHIYTQIHTVVHTHTCIDVCMCGMIWHGMAWHGMAWHGMAWHGMAWYCLVLYCIVLYCIVYCTVV